MAATTTSIDDQTTVDLYVLDQHGCMMIQCCLLLDEKLDSATEWGEQWPLIIPGDTSSLVGRKRMEKYPVLNAADSIIGYIPFHDRYSSTNPDPHTVASNIVVLDKFGNFIGEVDLSKNPNRIEAPKDYSSNALKNADIMFILDSNDKISAYTTNLVPFTGATCGDGLREETRPADHATGTIEQLITIYQKLISDTYNSCSTIPDNLQNSGDWLRSLLATKSEDTKLLATLAKDSSANVRKAVAQNRKTDPELLANLAQDSSAGVRKTVAQNENTDPDTIMKLSYDENPEVKTDALKNPNCPLERLVDDDV